MKLSDKKFVAAIAGLAGLVSVLIAPASQAGYWRHHWHPVGRSVRYSHGGCRKIVKRRYCRIRHGNRQCYVQRWARWTC